MVKIDLVTGFLGSGKTTFIKKYVSLLLSQGEKVGILENDYGAINVDMLLLNDLRGENCELEMIAGGCDLDCYRRRFKTKLISMAMSGYTRVVMEPSGVFDISDFYDVCREEPLDNWYEIGNVFCIVDALLDTHQSGQACFVLGTQIANAGCVILSKTSQATEERINQTKEYIDDILCKLKGAGVNATQEVKNSSILFFQKDWNEFDADDYQKLLKVGYRVSDCPKQYDFDALDFDSLYFMECEFEIEELKNKADILLSFDQKEVGNITRIKGFCYDKREACWMEINATRHETRIAKISAGQDVFIVIGEMLNKDKISEIIGRNNGI